MAIQTKLVQNFLVSLSILSIVVFAAKPVHSASELQPSGPELSAAERSANAKKLLKEARAALSPCDKGSLYQEIINTHPDIKEAEIAKKAIQPIKAKIIAQMMAARKQLKKFGGNEQALSQLIQAAHNAIIPCQIDDVREVATENIAIFEAFRKETFGY